MASLTFQNVASRRPAIRDLSLTCPDRGFTVLFGDAESGKSTLLRLAAGLEQTPTGRILVGDREVQTLPAGRREVTLATATAPLLPHLTIGENLFSALRPLRLARDVASRRLRETAGALDVETALDQKPGTLSPATRRRAEIARALAPQPKVVLLDEPLAGLDEAERAHLRADLAHLHERLRATIVATSEDAGEALTLATHLALLRHGEIVQQGAPLDLHRTPATVGAAASLGRPGMNFLRGAIKGSGRDLTFKESDGGAVELPLGDLPAVATYAGRDVLLGIRPEDCPPIGADAPNAPEVFQALVDFVEIREGGAFFHAQTGAHALISRSPTLVDPREAGRRARFRIDPARVHLFDPATSRRIA